MRIRSWALLLVLLTLSPHGAHAAQRALMRFPTLSGSTIVFVAHGNLWRVPRTGGTASRLTTDPGDDFMPRFSPDGTKIAFTASYQGNRDVYEMAAAGGPAQRLTFHSDVVERAPTRWGPDNMVVTWTPDSSSVVFLLVRTVVLGARRGRARDAAAAR
jgi:tricorn protease